MERETILDLLVQEVSADAVWDFWSVDPPGALRYFQMRPGKNVSFWYGWLDAPHGDFVDWECLRPLLQPVTVCGCDLAAALQYDDFSGAAFLQGKGVCPGWVGPPPEEALEFGLPSACTEDGSLDFCEEASHSSLSNIVFALLAWQKVCPGLDVEIRAIYPHLDNALIDLAHLSPDGLLLHRNPPNTLHKLWYRAACVLAGKNADALYDYILHGMDDDGDFLRTRHERWKTPLPDGPLRNPPTRVMATVETLFDFYHDTRYYGRSGRPKLRMQLFFIHEGDSFLEDAACAAEGGYGHIFIRDL